jgi:phage baseplate assembly protein W
MPERPIYVVGDRVGERLYGIAIKETFPDEENIEEGAGSWRVDGNNRLEVVSGVDCFVQGLRIGLRTELGSRPLAPQAGTILNRLVGRADNRYTAGFIKAEVIRFLRTDPRTESVGNVRVVIESGVIRIEAQVYAVNSSEPISFEAVIGRIEDARSS